MHGHSNKPIVLHKRVIVRDEIGHVLLYNGKTGGFVEIDNQAYVELFGKGDRQSSSSMVVSAWLYKNGFLKERAATNQDPAPRYRRDSTGARNVDKFFNLRSRKYPINLLWAITARCNLRCIYCFPDAAKQRKTEDLRLSQLMEIAEKIIDAKTLLVMLSGGECLLHQDVWKLVEKLKEAGTTVGLATNGTAMSGQTLENMNKHDVFVAVSLDSCHEEINAITRGKGVLAKTRANIARMIQRGVKTTVLATVTRHNFPTLEQLIQSIRALGVKSVTLQDLRPFGDRGEYDATRLTPAQESELEDKVSRIMELNPDMYINTSELLYFCQKGNASGQLMQCAAGDHFGYIDFRGDLFPCTSLPSFKMGNLLKSSSLVDLWRESPSIRQLRGIKNTEIDKVEECRTCRNKRHCDGGCRGDALFYREDLFGLPSRCPRTLGLALKKRA